MGVRMQEQVHHQQDNHTIVADPGDEGCNLQRDLFHGQQGCKSRGKAYHEGGGAVDDDGIFQGFIGGGSIQFLVDESAYDIGIDHRDHGCFRRSEFARIDPAQDDHRGQDGPNGIFERADNLFEGSLFRASPVASFFRDDVADNHQGNPHQDTGKETGCEQIGDGSPGDHPVNNEGDRRRDDDPDGTGRCGQSSRKGFTVAMFHHLGDHEGTNGRNRGYGRTGNGGEEHADHDGDHAQAAGDVADETFKEIHQAFGDPAAAHQVPGQHKERNGQ